MNTVPNQPFNAEQEKEAYKEYRKKESTVKYKDEDVVVDYKTLEKKKSTNTK